MEHFVKLRKLGSSLTKVEFDAFLHRQSFDWLIEILRMMKKEKLVQTGFKLMMTIMKKTKMAIVNALFDILVAAFQNAKNLSQISDVIIRNVAAMNNCIAQIIRSRDEDKFDNMPLSLEKLPNVMISHISSFLNMSQTTKFERCSRTLFIAVRSVPLPNMVPLPILNNQSYKADKIFRWQRLRGARSICFHCEHLPHLQLSSFQRLFPNLMSIEIKNETERFDGNATLRQFGSFLRNVKRLSLTEHLCGVFGYQQFKSLEYLNVHALRYNHETLFGENWLEYLVKENMTKLSHVDLHYYTEWEHQNGQGQDLVFEPISTIYEQCIAHPEWVENVLKSFKLRIWAIDCLDDDDMTALQTFKTTEIERLAELLRRNNVCFSFEVDFNWYEKECSDGALLCVEEVEAIKDLFSDWNLKNEGGHTITLRLASI